MCGSNITSCKAEVVQIVTAVDKAATSTGREMLLRDGLQIIQSNTVLELNNGTHMLDRFRFVSNLINVTIRGLQSMEDTTITCRDSFGLAFFNITNLLIQNITITNCGLNRKWWKIINNTFHQEFDVVISIPEAVKVALIIAACKNLLLEYINVKDTSGVGLLGVNLLGNANIRNSLFDRNTSPQCPNTTPRLTSASFGNWIGGGAYFLYQDFENALMSENNTLTITESVFSKNQDCSRTLYIERLLESSVGLVDLGYSIGAGGGLSIMMAQLQYSVDINITKNNFTGNLARSGGGAHVGLFSGAPTARLHFEGCYFTKNGRIVITSSGGGLQIYIDLIRPSEILMEHNTEDRKGLLSIKILDSVFLRNIARSGGAVDITSLYSEQHAFDRKIDVIFNGSKFTGNQATGGIVVVYEQKYNGRGDGLQHYICNCIFENSSKLSRGNSFVNYGTVNIENVNLTLCGDVTFRHNEISGLVAQSTLVNVIGNVLFEENEALNGAGMQLLFGSLLILKRNSNIVFRNNEAMFGGGIYVDIALDPIRDVFNEDCFLYFERPQLITCVQKDICTPENLNISIVFEGNEANIGSTVYGSALKTCSWLEEIRNLKEYIYDRNRSVYENFYKINHTFYFDKIPATSKQISTPTTSLRISTPTNLHIANNTISVIPGKSFTVDVIALDAFQQQIQEVITSTRSKPDMHRPTNITSIIGESNYFQLKARGRQIVPITTYGQQNLFAKIRLMTVNLRVSEEFTVFLNSCSIGFIHNSSSCICDERLRTNRVSCDAITTIFQVSNGYWLGRVGDNATNNDDLTIARCVLNYCYSGYRYVMLNETDVQCSSGFHRTGLLCGKCEPGYSVQLGSYRCAKCTNWYLLLIIFFALAGIAIVFFAGILRISVAEGFVCSCIFFSNILTLYAIFFDNRTHFSEINFVSAFLSLNFGFESCFYDGMDSQVLVTLQLVFVVYLLLLMLCQTFIIKHTSSKFVKTLTKQYSPSKIISTFIIISYVSLLQASVGILSFIVVQPLNGPARIMWLVDPTIQYADGFHAFLAILAFLIFFFYILPLPILLTFFTGALYRLKYFCKFKPLYDAMFAPYKVKYRPWLGIQLFTRLILFSFAYFVPSPHKLLLLGVCISLYLYIQTNLQPYNSRWVNVLESTLMTIIILLAVISLYIGNDISISTELSLLILSLILMFGYGVILLSFFRHFKFQLAKLWETVKETFKSKILNRKQNISKNNATPQIRVLDSIGQEIGMDDSTRNSSECMHVVNNSIHSASPELQVSFTEYREPLLDEGELDVSHSYAIVVSSRSSSATDLRYGEYRETNL